MKLSKEKLAHYAAHTEGPVKAMARELLERRERDKQEPVTWGLFHFASGEFYNACSSQGAAERHLNQVHQSNDSVTLIIRPLYAAPPAPVVPEELLTAMEEVLRISDRQHDAWDKAKAAITTLRAAPQSFGNSEQLNSPAVPDGWVKCSERMPAENENVYLANTEYPEMKGRVFVGWLESGKHQHFFIGNQLLMKATHWMKIGISMPRTPQQEEL